MSEEPLAVICREPRDSDIARMIEASKMVSMKLIAHDLNLDEIAAHGWEQWFMRRIYEAVVRGGELADD